MPNQLMPVQWEKPLRKSAVNTLDKINELVDYINNSDIHEFSFIESASGEEVTTGTSTALAELTVYGKSVQDGTPTPDNPVPVQVVGGRNLNQTVSMTTEAGAWNGNTKVIDNIQLEASTTATPYTPYGCIGLQIGDEITPIDLQGHTLPEGDILNIDSVGQVTLEQSGTPAIINLGTIDMPAIPSGSTVSLLASLTPTIDVSWWTEQAIPMLIESLKSYVDSKIDAVNTRINELHGITTMARPIASLTDKVSPDIINNTDEIEKLDTTEEEEQ